MCGAAYVFFRQEHVCVLYCPKLSVGTTNNFASPYSIINVDAEKGISSKEGNVSCGVIFRDGTCSEYAGIFMHLCVHGFS